MDLPPPDVMDGNLVRDINFGRIHRARGLPAVRVLADSGVKEARVKEPADAGADVLAAASAMFKSPHGDAAAAVAAPRAAI